MNKIAFVTSEEINGFVEPDKLVLPYLEASGHTVVPAIWSDSSVDWNSFDLVVIRSPWDYYKRSVEYAAWLKDCQKKNVKLLNPASVVLDNIDKRYLLDFQSKGISIVPSALVEKHSDKKLKGVLIENDWDKVVIKPVISGGSWDTWRSDLHKADEDEAEFARQKEKHNLFVQPFLPEIVEDGEYSVLYFNGKFSHSIVKRPKVGDYRIQYQYGGMYEEVKLGKDILAQTQKVIDVVGEKLLYARVDGIIRDGQFLLMELEINEPDLYFSTVASAAKRFANAVIKYL